MSREFKPTIWADSIFTQYENANVFLPLMNTSYQGQIKGKGDQVKINEIGSATAQTYTKGTPLVYEELAEGAKYLKIDQQDYTATELDDIDEAQNSPKLRQAYAEKMAIALGNAADLHVASKYDQAGSTITGTTGSPTSITSADVAELFTDAGVTLDDNNVPVQGRCAVVPPWLAGKIQLAMLDKDTNNSMIGRMGYRGNYLGFSVFASNHITKSGTTWYAPMFFRAGDTIAWANQITKVETLRDKDYPVDYIRAFNTYGCKVIRPSSLAIAYVSKGAEA